MHAAHSLGSHLRNTGAALESTAGSERAREIISRSMVCDMTVPWAGMPGSVEKQHVLPRRLINAGFCFTSLTMATDAESLQAAINNIEETHRFIAARPDELLLVKSVADIELAKKTSRLGMGLHFQGTLPLQRDLAAVPRLYELGIRHLLLAYNEKNLVGDGCHERTDAGLSNFGLKLIAEMNRVGMLVDVAHTGHRSSLEAIEASTQPVIVSHGNITAIHDHPRCYRDDQIKALAKSGGVIGLTGLGIFLGDNDASVERYVRSIRYVTDLVGHEHVGIGTDYVYDIEALTAYARSFSDRWPKSGGYTLQNVQQLEPEALVTIVDALLSDGFSDGQIRDVLGGNWLRVLKRVWK
jgi:membrane dipeptidase